MIDWLIVYEIVTGLAFRWIHHNRLVVSGRANHGFAYWLTGPVVRCLAYAFIFIQGSRLQGTIPDSYRRWWSGYFLEHSFVLWILTIGTLTLALYLLKEITYRTARDPHGYKIYAAGVGVPTILRTTMKTPLVWYLVFWVWLLTSPWLPFYTCFIRIYILGYRPAKVSAVSRLGTALPPPRSDAACTLSQVPGERGPCQK